MKEKLAILMEKIHENGGKVAVALCLCGLTACSSVDCALEKKVECRVQMMDKEGNPVTVDGYLTVSITDATEETVKDTLLNKLENASAFAFPLSYAGDVDKLNFIFSDKEDVRSVTDVISITKSNEPVFEGVDCTPRYNHTISGVTCTKNVIDSVVVNNKKVDNDTRKVHLHVYMRTAD